MGKLAALVLLKLLITGNKKYHSNDTPALELYSIFKCKRHIIHGSKMIKNYFKVGLFLFTVVNQHGHFNCKQVVCLFV